MPQFYFHLHSGERRVEDRSGLCLPDEEAAWYQAYRSARELVATGGGDRRQWQAHAFEVEDERGAQVWTLPVSELAEISC